jgi:hypothetical protein
MLTRTLLTVAALLFVFQGRPADIAFRIHPIDPGASETAAVADINRDGRLDLISGEYWYQAPAWTKRKFREVGFSNNYIDSFSVMPIDVDADGYPDIVDVSWFARKISWWRNPGSKSPTPQLPNSPNLWVESEISGGGNVEFAVMADVDNDGRALEIVAQQNGTPQAWFEVRNGAWVKHVVSDRTYGHGIGVGDVNGDKRNDILTPRGWLEAPADPRSGPWTYHTAWEGANAPLPPPASAGQAPPPPPQTGQPAAPPRVLELGFIHVVDVNGDGRNDVIAAAGHDYGVFWFEQGENGQWTRRAIDTAWSQGHASTLADLNGDGRVDLVTGKRFMAHNGSDPGEKEPLGIYWYEFRAAFAATGRAASAGQAGGRGPGASARVDWIRHLVEYGGRVGGGMQLPVVDVDGDGDLDLVCAGKSGLFFVENLTKTGGRLNR